MQIRLFFYKIGYVIIGSYVLKDYNIKQISECDATLVCEKLDVSVLEKCVNEFETLKTYKLEVLGIVYA